MNTPKRSVGRRLVAALGAAALGLVGVAGVAHADGPTSPPSPSYGNIDQKATGSITIHKYAENGAKYAAPDSGAAPVGAGDPLQATFTIYRISTSTFDPSTPSSWDAWSGSNGVANQIATTPGICATAASDSTETYMKAGEVTTDATTGAAHALSGLALGGYLVCETVPPAGAVATAAPFVVTLPTPYSGTWVYAVHAFPKNAVNTVEKSIDEQTGLGLGSTVTFPVTTTIQALPGGEKYTSFIIKDTLDSKLTPGDVTSVKVGGVALNKDTDYTAKTTGQTVVVRIYPSATAKIDAAVGMSVEVVFTATVNAVGEIDNTADLYVNNPDMTGVGIPSNEVTTNWGDVSISKVDSGDSTTGLAGAKFEVYAAESPYADTCSAVPTGSALAVSGDKKFTSTSAGVVSIPGLYVSDSVNDVVNSQTRCYVIKEIQAPAGYVTPTGDAALTAVKVTIGATSGVDVTIKNTKQNVPNLPLTGANGQLLALIGGGSLVLLAAGTALVARKRSHQD